MNPFNTTSLNYELARDRRHSFEQAATRRRLVRFASRRGAEPAPRAIRRPPDETMMRAA